MKPYISLIFILVTIAVLTQAALIEPVTRTPVRPYAINQNYSAPYLFHVSIPSAISSNAVIVVEFPMPYQIPANVLAYVKVNDGSFVTYPCLKPSYSKYIVQIGTIIAGEYQIAFENIRNPTGYPASSNFKIWTYVNNDVLVDSNEHLDAVPFLATPRKFIFWLST
jgi:hypothetical protein